jgi:hypothetical protein
VKTPLLAGEFYFLESYNAIEREIAMFENQLTPFEYARLHESCCPQNNYAHQYNSVFNKFKASCTQGNFFCLKMRLLHRQPFLYDLNAIKSSLHVRGSSYAGMKVVRIDAIVGSEGRISDFDKDFHPLHEMTRERWVNIAMAYTAHLPLPPIQLIEIGDAYFIRDGHHRVSVARAYGQTAMDAEVITWNATAPFPWQPEATLEKVFAIEQADLST